MRPRRLALALIIVVSIPLGAKADTYGDFLYTNSGTNITITSYTGTAANVSIPDTIDFLPVTTIGPYAFDSRTNMTDLVIPGSVNSVKYQAFSSCSRLTNLVLEEGMNGLDAPAFDGCAALRTVALPASAVNAHPLAFTGCSNLTNYSIHATNAAYSDIDGVWFSKDHSVLVGYPFGLAGAYTVPQGVGTIGAGAFAHCGQLDAVLLPATVTNVLANAFLYTGIYGITIPHAVLLIGERAFYGCSRLERILFLGDEPPEPFEPQWMFYDTLITAIYYRAGTSWTISYAGIPSVRCTATTPEPIAHPWILSDFPSVTTDEEYEQTAAADQDQDGVPSWEEYVAGTSPTNAADYFRIADMTTSGVIAWSSATSRLYSVYLSTNVSDSWAEEPLYCVRGDGSVHTYTNDPMSGIGFRRIGVALYR